MPASSVNAILEEGAEVQVEVRRELNEDFSNFPIQDTIAPLVTGRGSFADSEFTKPGQSHFAADIPIFKMADEEPIRVPDPTLPPEEPDPKKGRQQARKVNSRNAPKRKPKRNITPKDKKQIRALATFWQEFTDADGFDGHSQLLVDLQFSHALVLKPLVPHPTVKPSELCKKNPETRAHKLQEATTQFREAVHRLAVEIASAQKTRQDCQLAVPDFPDDLQPLLNKMPSYHVALEKLRIAISYTFSEFSLAHQAQSDQQMQMLQAILPMYLHDELGKQLPDIFIPPRKPVDPREFLIKESDEAELMGRKSAAAELLEELLAMDLSDADAWWLYSCLMLKHCDVSRAEECVRRGLTCDPNHLKLSILFASLLTRQEKYVEAIEFLNSAHFMDRIVEVVLSILNGLANLPAKPILKEGESPIPFASELMEMMDVVFAEQLIAQEQMAKGETSEVMYIFGKLHYHLHDFSKAVSFLGRAVSIEKTADALLLLGHIEYERERFEEAAKWFDQGLEMRFEQGAALRLGFIYIRMGEYLKAESILFQCSPQSASVLLGLAIASIHMEKYKQADELLNRATVVNPRHPEVWAHLALFSLKMDRSEEAEHAADMARKWNLTDEALIKKLKEAKLYENESNNEEEEELLNSDDENKDDVDSD
ncbi:TPR Domain containing protein [Tritrichomonas foetus]|uniref:TPR Domain containing protein n=1 Tax=Tritrichomonas foetus TaxID=1144522 RepID=A0A1J4K5Z0_9EUKA|nr:TPR Domain containing protein [Tritrichomonas foetus]|eukprot:OHT06579.1 TPR Domain containing protein [Tritrichomonas foetus]